MKSPQNEDKKQEPKINYRTPIYLQLREIVRTKIEDGEYLPAQIPSENDMAATYGISRITVRSAVDALVNEGLLRRVQGKGVFVVGNKIEQAIEEFSGFVPSIGKSRDQTSAREQTKLLRPAGDLFANRFRIRSRGSDLLYPARREPGVRPRFPGGNLRALRRDSPVKRGEFLRVQHQLRVRVLRRERQHGAPEPEIQKCNSKMAHILDAPDGVALMVLNALTTTTAAA